jgi:signal peptidase II
MASAAEVPAPSERLAIHSAAAHVRFWTIVVAGLALDLFSKYEVFHRLRQGGNVTLIPGVLEFHTTMNPGALFGIGAGQTGLFLVASVIALVLVLWMFAQCPAKRWLTQVALAGILAGALGNMYDRINVRLVPYAVATPQGRMFMYFEKNAGPDGEGVTLVEYPPVGDASRIDLTAEQADTLPDDVGYVRDFIKISKTWLGGKDVWPWVFNVADMLLVGGVGILALRMLFERSPRPLRPAPPAEKARLDSATPGS